VNHVGNHVLYDDFLYWSKGGRKLSDWVSIRQRRTQDDWSFHTNDLCNGSHNVYSDGA